MQMTILAACGACAKMSGTNCCDVKITESIMSVLALIVAICVGGYIIVKLIGVLSDFFEGRRKRKWDEMDKDCKRNAELLDKKLEIMKALCYTTVEREVSQDGKISKKYVDVLKSDNDGLKNIDNYLEALVAAQGKAGASTGKKSHE